MEPVPLQDWQTVQAALSRFGVDQSRQAIEAAATKGCTLAEIRALLEYAKRHRAQWKTPAGALYIRIMVQTPGRRIEEGWAMSNVDPTAPNKSAQRVDASRVHTEGPKFWQRSAEEGEA